MALADDILTLRDRAILDLTSAHDYFADTVLAWDLVRLYVSTGGMVNQQNVVTGTTSSAGDLLDRAPSYIAMTLTESTFQHFIAIFESYFFDLLRLWLLAYPQSLSGKKVDFKTVLELPDKEALTLYVVNRELNEVLYERPAAWFAYLEEKVKLGCPAAEEIDRLAEAKATRDVLAHNRGIVGKSYVAKAGSLARFKIGERIDLSEPYHRAVWELLCKLVEDVSDAAVAKVV